MNECRSDREKSNSIRTYYGDVNRKMRTAEENNYIPVVLCTDANYFIPAYCAVRSMLINYMGRRSIHVYFLLSDDIPDEYTDMLKRLRNEYSFFDFEMIEMGSSYNSVRVNVSYIKTASMYRLSIPRLLENIDKCIYIDSDLVFEGDVSELYDTNVDDVLLGGVKDFFQVNEDEDGLHEKLGIPSISQYINSGVLVMNLKRLREEKVAEKLEEEAGRDYPFNDQDVINSVCYGRIKHLPFRFNYMVPFINPRGGFFKDYFRIYGEDEVERALSNPVIVHYIGSEKPWLSKHIYGAAHWWKYAVTQNDLTSNKIINRFIEENKASTLEKIKTGTMRVLKVSRIYDLLKRIKALSRHRN